MHAHADRLHLSPSDVTVFLACEHLTTLSLAHARGESERPDVPNEQAELIFRKGSSTSARISRRSATRSCTSTSRIRFRL